MTGAAAVRRVELHRAPIFAQRALSAPAIAGGAAAEFSEQWRGHGAVRVAEDGVVMDGAVISNPR